MVEPERVFKTRFRFTEEHDAHLLREVFGQNPYEDQGRWANIQVNMIQITGKSLSIRSLRERVQNLMKKFLARKKAEEGRSGIEVEVTEMDDTLQQIYEQMKEFQNKKGKAKIVNMNLEGELPIQSKTSYQRGYEMREEAVSSLSDSLTEMPMEITEIVIDEAAVSNEDITLTPNDETGNQTATPLTRSSETKRPLAQLNIATPSRKRTPRGNIKQTTIQYLSKKNDRQCELRCRELSLQEKKSELDEYERKKKVRTRRKKASR